MYRYRGPRRALAAGVAALLGAASLGACSSPPERPAGSASRPGPSGTATAPTPRAGATDLPHTSVAPGTAPDRPFAVGVRELRLHRGDRPLPVTVWYPARGSAGGEPERGAAVAAGRFPLVLFSHGLTGRPADYEALLTGWAAGGFVVAAPAYPRTSRRNASTADALDVINQPADASYALTQVLALDARSGDPLRGHLDPERVGAAGHSAGGITTIGLFTVARDARLDAGVVLAGSALGVGTTFTGPAAPQLFVHGQLDEVVSYASGRAVYDQVPWPKAMLSLPKGDHGGSLRDGDAAFDVIAATTLDFLRWSLYGDPAGRRRLPATAARGGLAALDDRL
ncbi:chlorophyllase [Micromonospora sp. NPDC049559]|uniref:alpha/beta hydrolase family protein n=1 Tax=Micromonospora sp. NPDC049559 TaxID=3155923 RepID=UPI00342F185F